MEPIEGYEALFEAILNGESHDAISLTESAIAEGCDPQELVSRYMVPAMDEVGELFGSGEFFVPELLISARAMKGSLALPRPLLAESGAAPAGTVVIGTVKGDLHDIGKDLVSSMLEGGGFEIVDLGVDVTPEEFAVAAEEHDADVVALSALLTTTMGEMSGVIDELVQSGIRDRMKVLVGGAPVTEEFADAIGADGFSDSAGGAVREVRRLVGDGAPQ